jgi:hypothetical protein
MTDHELDLVYTSLCRTMTRLGEANATLFLGRLSLLALARLASAADAQQLVAEAAVDIVPAVAGEPPIAPQPSAR